MISTHPPISWSAGILISWFWLIWLITLTLWLPNTYIYVFSLLSSLCWSWHSEESKMVWHLKISLGDQKLEIFKLLRKKLKIFFLYGEGMVIREMPKIMEMLEFFVFSFLFLFQSYLSLPFQICIIAILNVHLLLKSDSKNVFLWLYLHK